MEGVPAAAQRDEVPRFHDHESGALIEGLPAPLPCPFCGSSDFGAIVEGGAPDHRTFHVTCDSCGADGSLAASQLEAAERWNSAQDIPFQDRLSTIVAEIDDVIFVDVSAARAALDEFICGQAKESPTLNLILSSLREATHKGYALCGQARELLP